MQHMIVMILFLVCDIVKAINIFPNVHSFLEYLKSVRKSLLQRQLNTDCGVPVLSVRFGADLGLILLCSV